MKCPDCVRNGQRSRVYLRGSRTTGMAVIEYYDEDGKYHKEDPNITTTTYECGHGHIWTEKTRGGERIEA